MDKPSGDSARKPKALFLSPEAPFPVIGGGPVRSASLVEYLAQRYSVHAIVFREGDRDLARAVPPGRVDRLDIVDLPHHSRHILPRLLRNSARLVRRTPPLMDRFSGFAGSIAAAIGENQYETAIIEHFWCAPYLEQVRPHAKQVLLDLHNIESAWHDSLAKSSGLVRGWALRRFATASVALERKWLPEFDSILVTSAPDAMLVRQIAPTARVAEYPNALPEIPAPELRGEAEEIVFSGNLGYEPNIDAIQFFFDRIWPSLRSRWPNLRWRIVGKNSATVAKLLQGDSRITVTGFVEDAVKVLAGARVAVVPLLSGSGTRVKILEAWAAGIPVVSTTIGAAGLEGVNGAHFLIADDPGQFAQAVSSLLDSETDRARIGVAGRQLFEQRYTWPAAWRTLDGILGNPIAGKGV